MADSITPPRLVKSQKGKNGCFLSVLCVFCNFFYRVQRLPLSGADVLTVNTSFAVYTAQTVQPSAETISYPRQFRWQKHTAYAADPYSIARKVLQISLDGFVRKMPMAKFKFPIGKFEFCHRLI